MIFRKVNIVSMEALVSWVDGCSRLYQVSGFFPISVCVMFKPDVPGHNSLIVICVA